MEFERLRRLLVSLPNSIRNHDTDTLHYTCDIPINSIVIIVKLLPLEPYIINFKFETFAVFKRILDEKNILTIKR